jgi:hypothetical protein
MNEQIKARIKAIIDIAIAHHNAGNGCANAMIGKEREEFIKDILEKIFPRSYRFSSGEIISKDEKKSGQADLVLEFYDQPSFPSPVGNERIIIAESAICAFEVKSSWSQLDEIKRKVKQIKNISRDIQPLMMLSEDEIDKRLKIDGDKFLKQIPVFAVIYEGPINLNTLKGNYDRLDECEKPDAILCLNNGFLVYDDMSFEAEEGLYVLINLISNFAN